MPGTLGLVGNCIDAFNRGDFDSFAGCFAPHAKIVPLRGALEGTSFSGTDAPREFWQATQEIWEETRLDVEEIREVGDCVVAIGWLRARGRESGAPVETRVGWTSRVEAGSIVTVRTHASVDAALESANRGDC